MIRFLQTPGPLKKIILGGLLLVICAAMVITLVPGGLGSSFGIGGPAKGVVASVAGIDITTAEVTRQARQMVRSRFPKGGEQANALLPFFSTQAAQQLIEQKALLAEADRLGLRATDQEVADELQHGQLGAMLFPNGKFIGQEGYEDFVQRNDMTVPQFEELVKEDILQRKVSTLVTASASVTDAEVHQEYEQRNTKVKFDYAVLSKDDLAKSIHPTDTELKAFYDSNKQQYANSIPEKRKVQYIVLNTSNIAAQMPVSEQDLQAYYDQNRDQFRSPEQVKVSHILIKTPLPGPDGKVDQKGVDAARQKAEDILKQIKGGANFADVAKKYSEDTDTAKNGGSLGWIERGRFPSPEVDKAAFSLPKGGTSGVINAGYGFDILHIDDKQDAHVKTLAEVKDQITPIIQQQKAQRTVDNMANTLLSLARTQSMEKAAASKNLQLVTTDYVSRADALPGLGPSPSFMDAVFNETNKDQIDEAQIPQGYAIFDVLDIKPPATPTFEEVRSRVEAEFRNQLAAALLSQKTQELSDRAKAEHNLKKAAKELGATMKTSDSVTPADQVPDVGSMSGNAAVIFSMKPGEITGPIENGNNGTVLMLVDKQAPSDADFAAKQDEIRESLLQAKQNEIFSLFVTHLRDDMEKSGKIKINQEEMKALSRSQSSDEGE
jgi:peptidyl-prolyl cis-trans isomerase D